MEEPRLDVQGTVASPATTVWDPTHSREERGEGVLRPKPWTLAGVVRLQGSGGGGEARADRRLTTRAASLAGAPALGARLVDGGGRPRAHQHDRGRPRRTEGPGGDGQRGHRLSVAKEHRGPGQSAWRAREALQAEPGVGWERGQGGLGADLEARGGGTDHGPGLNRPVI